MADLGMSPLANSYIKPDELEKYEIFYPLVARVCENCFLVQVDEFEPPHKIFSDYAYFSSYSQTWLDHCKKYADEVTERFGLDSNSVVVEVASNDGHLLQYFKEKNIPVLGVEPAVNVALVATNKGIPTVVEFFGAKTAHYVPEKADLLIGNNVLAHVPDINDFVAGLKMILAPDGVLTVEFPHVLNLLKHNQFDTIYHEHFSYLSLGSVVWIFKNHNLDVFDVQKLPTHGGSLRIFAQHDGTNKYTTTEEVWNLFVEEQKFGLSSVDPYKLFSEQIKRAKINILKFFIEAKEQGKTVAGFGAPAKGNTLLNYCGIKSDFLEYTVDETPAKIGTLLPGTHIPVYSIDKIKETKPDYVFILPWNFKEEIMAKMAHIREWGGKFVVPIPEIKIYD